MPGWSGWCLRWCAGPFAVFVCAVCALQESNCPWVIHAEVVVLVQLTAITSFMRPQRCSTYCSVGTKLPRYHSQSHLHKLWPCRQSHRHADFIPTPFNNKWTQPSTLSYDTLKHQCDTPLLADHWALLQIHEESNNEMATEESSECGRPDQVLGLDVRPDVHGRCARP